MLLSWGSTAAAAKLCNENGSLLVYCSLLQSCRLVGRCCTVSKGNLFLQMCVRRVLVLASGGELVVGGLSLFCLESSVVPPVASGVAGRLPAFAANFRIFTFSSGTSCALAIHLMAPPP